LEAEEQLHEEMMQTVHKFQELSTTETVTPSTTRPLQKIHNIIKQIETDTIQVPLRSFMAFAPSVTEHIQQHMFPQPASSVPTLRATLISVAIVAAIDRPYANHFNYD